MADEVKHTTLINNSSQIIETFKIRGRTIKEWYLHFDFALDNADTIDIIGGNNCRVGELSHEVSYYVNSSRLRLLSLKEELDNATRSNKERILANPPNGVRLTQDRLTSMIDLAIAEYTKAFRIAEFEFEFWESIAKLLVRQADRIDKQIMISLSERKYEAGRT
jgi:hypothetical protein